MTEPNIKSSLFGTTAKSLKDQNRWQLWLVVAFNTLFLYGVVKENTIRLEGVRAALTSTANLLPIGFALIITSVLNGVLSQDSKSRLVFLRWKDALPGHRAFTEHATSDPRIDLGQLEKLHGAKLPTEPKDQNRVWYRMYRSNESEPAVRQVHRDFLLLRDYTGLSALFFLFYGIVGVCSISSWKVGSLYVGCLVAQYLVVRLAAFNYGVSLVKTVLAQASAPCRKKERRSSKTPD
jgi:hypothetical protein